MPTSFYRGPNPQLAQCSNFPRVSVFHQGDLEAFTGDKLTQGVGSGSWAMGPVQHKRAKFQHRQARALIPRCGIFCCFLLAVRIVQITKLSLV